MFLIFSPCASTSYPPSSCFNFFFNAAILDLTYLSVGSSGCFCAILIFSIPRSLSISDAEIMAVCARTIRSSALAYNSSIFYFVVTMAPSGMTPFPSSRIAFSSVCTKELILCIYSVYRSGWVTVADFFLHLRVAHLLGLIVHAALHHLLHVFLERLNEIAPQDEPLLCKTRPIRFNGDIFSHSL